MEGYCDIFENLKEMNADELRGIIEGAVFTFNVFQEIKETDIGALIDILTETNNGNSNRRGNYNYHSVYSSRSKQDS